MAEIEELNVSDEDSFSNFVQNDQLSLKSYFYSWSVDNFTRCLAFSNAKVCSPVFEFENTGWRLCMHVVSKNDQLDEIRIRLNKVKKCGNSYNLKYKFSLCDDKGPIVAKESMSKIEGDCYWGRRLTFANHGFEKAALDSVLMSDKLIIHCEFMVYSSVSQENKVDSSISNKSVKKEKPKQPSSHGNDNESKQIMQRFKETKPLNDDVLLCLILVPLFFFILTLMAILPQQHVIRNKNDAKIINELIIDTTLKIIKIADALNLTDVKMKSFEVLGTYNNSYNFSDVRFQNENVKLHLDSVTNALKLNITDSVSVN